MLRFPLAAAFALVSLMAGCANVGTGTPSGKTPITRDFVVVTQGWQRQDSLTRYIYLARNRGGVTEVCGAIYSEGTGIVRSLEQRLLNGTALETESGTLTNSISFFNRLNSFENGSMANCVVTDVPWEQRWVNSPPELRARIRTFEV